MSLDNLKNAFLYFENWNTLNNKKCLSEVFHISPAFAHIYLNSTQTDKFTVK